MGGLEQGESEGLVLAHRAVFEAPLRSLHGQGLGLEFSGHGPSAQARRPRKLDHRGRHIAGIHGARGRLGIDDDPGAHALGRRRRPIRVHHRGTQADPGVLVGLLHPDAKGQQLMAQFRARLQPRGRNGHHLIEGIAAGAAEQGQFEVHRRLGVVPRIPLAETHDAFAGQHVGGQLTQQQQDDADVGHEDAALGPGPLEAGEMGHDQVDDQHRSQQVATGQRHHRKRRTVRGPIGEPTAEVALLGHVEPIAGLTQRAEEHHGDTQSQQHHGQAQGRQELEYLGKHGQEFGRWPIGFD